MSNYNKTQFSRKIIYLSAILSILVVAIHTYNIGIYHIEPTSAFNAFVYYYEEYWHRYEEFCVPFFFILSGYLFYVNYSLIVSTIKKKYFSRFRTLFIPFILWNSIGYIFYALITHFPFTASKMNMTPVDLSVNGYLYAMWDSTYNGSLWYVRNLLILIAFSPIIYVLFKNYKKIPLGIFSLVFFMLYIFTPMHIFTYDRYDRNIYFFIGAYIAINHKDYLYQRRTKSSLSILLISLLMNFLPTTNEFMNFVRIIASVYAIWFLPIDALLEKEPKWYMKISFFVYCAHSIILETLEKIWLIIGGLQAISALADYLLMPFIAIMIITLGAKMIKVICPPMWNTLAGGRG